MSATLRGPCHNANLFNSERHAPEQGAIAVDSGRIVGVGNEKSIAARAAADNVIDAHRGKLGAGNSVLSAVLATNVYVLPID